ncbi:hypothetical protein [Actinocorallia libanotica]|uniref:Neocarzinostatin family protein n=1 Tax=Actinocorallia libanotica TaxID=46162 RepID=A0ABN1Q3G7_9ACTN
MSSIRRIVLTTAAAATLAAGLASPASAFPSGNYVATLTSADLVVKVFGITVATCTDSTLSGAFSGGGYSVTSATISGCGVAVTPSNTPWTGTTPAAPTKATLSNFQVSTSTPACTYGGPGAALEGLVVDSDTISFNDSVSKTGGGLSCPGSVQVIASYDYAPA